MPVLAGNSMQAIREQGLNQLVRIHQRFERPSNFVPESWEESRLRDLKEILGEIPAYQESSQAAHLTDQPNLFHVHPEDLEVMLRNPYDDFPSREYRDHATKFLSSTPSRADYALVAELMKNAKYEMQMPRSFIAHSLGVTEFTYPSDAESLEKMAVESRDIRDEAMLNFRWRDIMRRLFTIDELTVVTGLIDELNSRLHDGFSVKLTPLKDK